MSDITFETAAREAAGDAVRPLSKARRGDVATILRVDGSLGTEIERRLLEMGFVEGARVEVLHEGLFGRDPLALRVDDMRVALRRREASAVSLNYGSDA